MTEQEALALAQSAIPEEANSLYALDRSDPAMASMRGNQRSVFIKRCYIGCGNHCYGNGSSWAEAVENLLVMAGKAVRA